MISLLQAKIIQLEKASDSIVVKSEEFKFIPEPPSSNKPADAPRAKQFVDKKPEFSFEEADFESQKRKVPAPILTETPSGQESDRIPKVEAGNVKEILKHISLRM